MRVIRFTLVIIIMLLVSACGCISQSSMQSINIYSEMDKYLTEKYEDYTFTRINQTYKYEMISNGPWVPNSENTVKIYETHYSAGEDINYPIVVRYNSKNECYTDNLEYAKEISNKIEAIKPVLNSEEYIITFDDGGNLSLYTSNVIESDAEIKELYKLLQEDVTLKSIYTGLTTENIKELQQKSDCYYLNGYHIIVNNSETLIKIYDKDIYCYYNLASWGIADKTFYDTNGKCWHQVFNDSNEDYKSNFVNHRGRYVKVTEVNTSACYCRWEDIN